jgi:limonene-1,2-epoxide hydrolase
MQRISSKTRFWLACAMAAATLGALPAHAIADTASAETACKAQGQSDAGKLVLARQMVQAWKDRNWRLVADLFAQDGSLHSMMGPPVIGREAVYGRISALGAGIEAITLDVSHMGVIDGLVFIERVDRFTYKGKAGAVPVVGILAIKDCQITDWREYYDRNQLLSEMGALPPPAAH